MKHLMIDVETLGTSVNAPIIQIGAVYFNAVEGPLGDEFARNIDIDSVLQHGFLPDGGTIRWWLEQEYDARMSLKYPEPEPLIEVLQAFNKFIEPAERLWCHATFDWPLVANHFYVVGLRPDFKFSRVRDCRTILELADLNLEDFKREEGIHHNALDDAKFQARYTAEGLRRLTGSYRVQNELIQENARLREELHVIHKQGPL